MIEHSPNIAETMHRQKPRRGLKISIAARRQILRMHHDGATRQAIATIMGIHRNTVARIIDEGDA